MNGGDDDWVYVERLEHCTRGGVGSAGGFIDVMDDDGGGGVSW